MVIFSLGLSYRNKINERAVKESEQKTIINQQLQELDELKTRFYTNITHEFRTPLTVIRGMADQIEATNRQEASLIKRNSDQLLLLVNQLLDLSKLKLKKKEKNLINGEVISYLKYISESYQSLAKNKKISLSFTTSEQELFMDYDPDSLQKIIVNLLSNAYKFTKENGTIIIQVEQHHKLENQSFLQIQVSDTGIGISEKDLPFIFDQFYQVNNSSTRKQQGTGIGLAHTKELIHALNGTINVQSQFNKGTIFTISLPITNTSIKKDSTIPSIETPISKSLQVSLTNELVFSNQERLTVLLVEDNQDVLFYITKCLQNNYKILTATNGKIGTQVAFKEVPDIIISDIMMPDMDGFDLCKVIKEDERTSHIPIILLTAKADQASKLKGLKYGADAYLIKPFEPEELEIRLIQLTNIRKKIQAYFSKVSSSATFIPPTIDIQLEEKYLQRIRIIVEDKIEDSTFGVTKLTKEMGSSRTTIYRKVKSLTGRSIADYIRLVRLQKAKTLLKKKELNVNEIAFKVGFRDHAYFSKCYFDEFGLKPSADRT